MPGVSLHDQSAWDDSALVSSWDEAVAEYKKYHSIARSGKRLEDVLSADELKKLRGEHRDLIEEVETRSSDADPNNHADHDEAEWHRDQANETKANDLVPSHAAEPAASEQREHVRSAETGHDAPLAAAMPQAVLGTVQDENLKNVMMSWYYAGYYTGLVAGQEQGRQQQAASNNATAGEGKRARN